MPSDDYPYLTDGPLSITFGVIMIAVGLFVKRIPPGQLGGLLQFPTARRIFIPVWTIMSLYIFLLGLSLTAYGLYDKFQVRG